MSSPTPRRAVVAFDANPEWVDDEVVARAVDGKPTGRRITTAERAAAVRELARRGTTPSRIAEHLNMQTRRVHACLPKSTP